MSDPTSINIAGHRTRIFDIGSGDPVVVLHGWGGRIESMRPVIECLADRSRVIALDLPGFGESPAPESAWGTSDYGNFVRAHLSALEIERAHFVGHSFGAKTSLYLAATVPDVVEKLVLVGASGLRSAPSLKTQLRRGASRAARGVGQLGGPGRRLRDAIYRRIASEDYRNAGPLRPTFVKVVNEDLSDLLPRISAPTLLVWGDKDDAAPLAHARTMERAIPDAGLVVFEGAGHFCYLEQPDRFCRIVRHFLVGSTGD